MNNNVYQDIMYDARTHKGMLEKYVRQKRSREGKTVKRNTAEHSDCPFEQRSISVVHYLAHLNFVNLFFIIRKRLQVPSSDSFSAEQVDDAEKFMRNKAIDKTNIQIMLHKLYITRPQRRKFIAVLINKNQ